MGTISHVFILLFLLIVAVTLTILIPVIIRRTRSNKLLYLMTLVPLLLFAGYFYFSSRPSVQLYRDDFTAVTGLPFPDDGEILYKSSTYFPQGSQSHASISVVAVGQELYNKIEQSLLSVGYEELAEEKFTWLEQEVPPLKINKIYTDEGDYTQHSVILFSDGETVGVSYQRW